MPTFFAMNWRDGNAKRSNCPFVPICSIVILDCFALSNSAFALNFTNLRCALCFVAFAA